VKLKRTQRYRLRLRHNSCNVVGPGQLRRFNKPATQNCAKLYAASHHGRMFYIGVTTQPMAARLRYGLQATGSHGYHGYRWRFRKTAVLDVWYLDGTNKRTEAKHLQCIEAEVVYYVRQKYDQWPSFQTEIHFHPSRAFHRDAARRIIAHLDHAT
jgi:hypothetical protein